MSSYQLRTDAIGRKRLNLQGEVYNPGSQNFLLSQGLKEGLSILEVGCGSGTMSVWLAQQVGKHGRVVCIDNDRSQIKATQQVIKKAKLTQVECRELSVFDLDQMTEQFDIIYVRFVLLHLADPLTALIKIKSRLKKDGKLVIDEMLNSNNFCHPVAAAFIKRREVMERFFLKNNLNPNFGLTLKPVLKKIGLHSIEESLFQPMLISARERQLLLLVIYEIKDKLIALNILTSVEWKKLVADLEVIQRDKNYFIALSSLYQLSAEK